MGWSGGTEIFNSMYPIIYELGTVRTEKIVKAFESLIQELWNQDWDTESDSVYFMEDACVRQAVYNLDPDIIKEFWEDPWKQGSFKTNIKLNT